MARLESQQQQRLLDRTTELYNLTRKWELQVGTQMQTQAQSHWEYFEKRWESRIVQLEPGAEDGFISAAEYRSRLSIRTEMDQK